MIQIHTQERVKCTNVRFDELSRIISLSGDSSNSLVERGAVVSGGSLNNSVISGKLTLINCDVRNAVVTGNGLLQNQVIETDMRLKDVRPPAKRIKYVSEPLFPIETSQLEHARGVSQY